ncbi:MAG: GLPGLI family protein [Bacteroidota bacterium]
MKISQPLLILIMLSALKTYAQQPRFTTSGKIEFEKRVNTYALIRRGEISGKRTEGNERVLLEAYQQDNPQFKILKSTLTFNTALTLFTPVDTEAPAGQGFSMPIGAQNNTIYSDHTAGIITVKKNVMGENFLLDDSVRNINWKITDETREVCGFTCRRANALVMDSIYVVAFFAEQIHAPGGPESFGGLPGMILELALPHENVSWKAIKVEEITLPVNTLIPPKGGKKRTKTELIGLLKDITKNQSPKATNLMLKASLL